MPNARCYIETEPQAIFSHKNSMQTERIAIIGGTGDQGKGLALRWARAGYAITIGSRDAARARPAVRARLLR